MAKKKNLVVVAHAGEQNPDYFLSIIQIPDDFREYQRRIGCDCITIVQRSINGKLYELVCDDEALLKSGQYPCAQNQDFDELIYGNIVIVGPADRDGNLTSLSQDDVKNISQAVRPAFFRKPDGSVVASQLLTIWL